MENVYFYFFQSENEILLGCLNEYVCVCGGVAVLFQGVAFMSMRFRRTWARLLNTVMKTACGKVCLGSTWERLVTMHEAAPVCSMVHPLDRISPRRRSWVGRG